MSRLWSGRYLQDATCQAVQRDGHTRRRGGAGCIFEQGVVPDVAAHLISPAKKYEGEILRWVIGIYLMVLFVGATQRRMHGKTNPYQNVVEFVVGVITILMLPAASISLLLAPRSTTPEAQLVERVLAGTGLCLLLFIAGWYLWEYRRGARGNRPPDAGIRSPLSPVPSVAAGNTQKLPEEESTR